ncbi:hypothetical protein RFI_08046, partial [Reticulomyxa filosa]
QSPFYIDPNKELMGELNFHSLPRSYLVDKNGYLISAFKRTIDWSDKFVFEEILRLKNNSSKSNKDLTFGPDSSTNSVNEGDAKDLAGNVKSDEVNPIDLLSQKENDNKGISDIISATKEHKKTTILK